MGSSGGSGGFWSLKLRMLSQLVVLLFAVFAAVRDAMAPGKKVGARVLLLVVLAMAIGLMVSRDTYLPFLGYAAFPPAAIVAERVPDKADRETQIAVDAPDGTRIVYWGASKDAGHVVPDPWTAYGDYANTGVAFVRDGVAKLRFQCPTQYKVGFGGRTLSRHLHYRVCGGSGLIGPVETTYVTCE